MLTHLFSTCPNVQGLHGGVIASLVDTMGSLALASRGLYMTGVSIDMSQTSVARLNFFINRLPTRTPRTLRCAQRHWSLHATSVRV